MAIMGSARLVVLLCAFAVYIVFEPAAACIYKFGTSPDSLSSPHGGTHWDHGMNGDDWAGLDAKGKPWSCLTGLRQSPINVPHMSEIDVRGSRVPRQHKTSWNYPNLVSNGSNIEVINNGHTIQVEWLSPYGADVQIVVPVKQSNTTTVTAVLGMADDEQATKVHATPLQFHFHANSEHLIGGRYFPLEMHIVHRVTELPACAAAGGCYSVTGILFELSEGGDNPLLDSIWAAMPMREGAINYLPAGAEIKLGKLLPPHGARNYVTYEGSLTTPPCSEGLLWHVMLEPQPISHAQWAKYQRAIGYKDCSAANATAPGEHAHHHRHHHRRLLAAAEPAGNPDDYTCKLVAYGYNYRSSQKLYGRVLKYARAHA